MINFKKVCSFALVSLALGGTAQAAGLTREVKVVEGTETHSYVGNQFGQTLYTFDLDTATKSAAYGKTAEQWPPFLIDEAVALTLAAPYGTITRTNGLLQLTLNGSPLYTYYLDRIEGDDKGDSIGGVWHDIDFTP